VSIFALVFQGELLLLELFWGTTDLPLMRLLSNRFLVDWAPHRWLALMTVGECRAQDFYISGRILTMLKMIA